MKRIGGIAAVLALAICPAAARAGTEAGGTFASYGASRSQFFRVFPGGPATVLLLHENGETWRTIANLAEALQQNGYTVLDLEWEDLPERPGEKVWGTLTGEIEAAVRYADAHSTELGIDPSRVAMVGGSRGANLALLTSLNMNAAAPGTIKAVVSLSGDVNPVAQVERAEEAMSNGEHPNIRVVRKFARTYGCRHFLARCPMEYLEEWSPIQKTAEPQGVTAPPMLLAASVEEHYAADWEDQGPMAEVLEEQGVPAKVVIPQSGHGFGYMSVVRKPMLAFLAEHDVG
jgi:acetyl esterase/lipase